MHSFVVFDILLFSFMVVYPVSGTGNRTPIPRIVHWQRAISNKLAPKPTRKPNPNPTPNPNPYL